MVSGNLARTGYQANETTITKENVGDLAIKWAFETTAPVAASPVVATVDLPDEGETSVVYVGSYDANVYAIRAEDGTEVWHFTVKPHPGVSYGAIVSSAAVAEVDGRMTVYVGGGQTMYALDAATGEKLWEFDAGTGCETCDAETERNEILSSPAVLPEEDLLTFGMDVNDSPPGKGGFYGLSARDGRMLWFFDLESGATCVPNNGDNIRRFDGYHSADELNLPPDFFSTREGCSFDRTETACGNVWSPVSVDTERELLYFTSSNCDTDDDPTTAKPPPPMPLYDEALVALHYDGTPAWTWRPREIDNEDLAFGAAPNLFTATIKENDYEVVGVGGKDGSYYLLDRDGTNKITGELEPYWTRHYVEGSDIGGTTGTAVVLEDRIFLTTAINPGAPAWMLSASDGNVIWSQEDTVPYYGPSHATPGLLWTGGIDAGLHALDADTGEVLVTVPLGHIVFSGPAVVDGTVYIGSGFGALNAGAEGPAKDPGGLFALCIRGEEGCENATPPATP
jgi:polyvinyl alcohol dehydrogenase (cytochrome)